MSLKNKALIALIVIFIAVNHILITDINKIIGTEGYVIKMLRRITGKEGENNIQKRFLNLTGNLKNDAIEIIMIKGIPSVYGKEMNVVYDRVQDSINIMKNYDPKEKTLTREEFETYMNVTGSISCEFCCTAKALTNSDGTAACDCAHAKAMRGLAAYLVQNHKNEFDRNGILTELARWKGVYFPKQMIKKFIKEQKEKVYSDDIKAMIDGITLPEYGPENWNNDNEQTENLPDMIGGC